MRNEVKLIDCMQYMKTLPDNAFDLAIVDPEYGLDVIKNTFSNRKLKPGKCKANKSQFKSKSWDEKPVSKKTLAEIIRVSKNKILWGANHYIENIYLAGKINSDYFSINSSCWITWDKENGGNDFADCELAWTSFNSAVRKFSYRWNGMIQQNMKRKEKRIHPTQKPIALYKWLLANYAKPGDTIFDSHVGSGSIRIACHDMGFDFTGCELDLDYWQAQEDRYQEHIKNKEMFDTEEYQELIYEQGKMI